MGTQRSRHHVREQNRDLGIKKSSNLTDTEFKTLVIRMLNELRVRIDDLSENSNREIVSM